MNFNSLPAQKLSKKQEKDYSYDNPYPIILQEGEGKLKKYYSKLQAKDKDSRASNSNNCSNEINMSLRVLT